MYNKDVLVICVQQNAWWGWCFCMCMSQVLVTWWSARWSNSSRCNCCQRSPGL